MHRQNSVPASLRPTPPPKESRRLSNSAYRKSREGSTITKNNSKASVRPSGAVETITTLVTPSALPTIQTSLSFVSDDQTIQTVPSSSAAYRGGGRNCGRFHSFSIPSNHQQPKPERAASSSKFRWKRSSAVSISTKVPGIYYGYASATYQFQGYGEDEEGSSEGGHSVPALVVAASADGGQEARYPDQEENFDDDDEEEEENGAGGNEDNNEEEDAVFFTRLSDNRILPIYCCKPTGHKADAFIESLTEKQRDCLRRFMEKEKPDEGEAYVWVRDAEDAANKTTVLSIKALENHFKLAGDNRSQIRRVKWRHVSLDKITVYRYSLPVITTKFRLRIAHFLSRNYRCCILCVWCLVILLISVGIVLSVVFGSVPQSRNMNITHYAFDHDQKHPSVEFDRPKRHLLPNK